MVVKFREPDADIFKVAALSAPGLVITVITQAHWSRHKSEFTGGDEQRPTTAPVEDAATQGPARRRTRQRRRGRARARGRR